MGFSFIYYANSPRDRICSLEIQLGMVGFLESEKPQIHIFWPLSKLPFIGFSNYKNIYYTDTSTTFKQSLTIMAMAWYSSHLFCPAVQSMINNPDYCIREHYTCNINNYVYCLQNALPHQVPGESLLPEAAVCRPFAADFPRNTAPKPYHHEVGCASSILFS